MKRWVGLVAVMAGGFVSEVHADEKPSDMRFDVVVREDLFAGFRGDKEALERGLKNCEEALAKNPKNAEALVWLGGPGGYSRRDRRSRRKIRPRGSSFGSPAKRTWMRRSKWTPKMSVS